MRRDVLSAGPILNSFIDAELAAHKLPPDRLILIGFSQGAVTVLNIGLRRKILPAAIVAFAGANLANEALPLFRRAPPVLLIDGSEDHPEAVGPVVRTLKNSDVNVQSLILPGLGHAIDGRGLALAGAFLREVCQEKPKL
jgi:phospholipase/carboxylesterase